MSCKLRTLIPHTLDDFLQWVPCPPPETEYQVFITVAQNHTTLNEADIEQVKLICKITEPTTTTTTSTTTSTSTSSTTIETTTESTTTTEVTITDETSTAETTTKQTIESTSHSAPPTTASTSTSALLSTSTNNTTSTVGTNASFTTMVLPPSTTSLGITTDTANTTTPLVPTTYQSSSAGCHGICLITVSLVSVGLAYILLALFAWLCRMVRNQGKMKTGMSIQKKKRGQLSGRKYKPLRKDSQREVYDNPTYRQSASSVEMQHYADNWTLVDMKSEPFVWSTSTFKPTDSVPKSQTDNKIPRSFDNQHGHSRGLARISKNREMGETAVGYYTCIKELDQTANRSGLPRNLVARAGNIHRAGKSQPQEKRGTKPNKRLPRTPVDSLEVRYSGLLPNGAITNTKFIKPTEQRRKSPVKVQPVKLTKNFARNSADRRHNSLDSYTPYRIPTHEHTSYPVRENIQSLPRQPDENTSISHNRLTAKLPNYSNTHPYLDLPKPSQRCTLPRYNTDSPDEHRFQRDSKKEHYSVPYLQNNPTGQPKDQSSHRKEDLPLSYHNYIYDNSRQFFQQTTKL